MTTEKCLKCTKVSDLKAPTTNSGGRKARPYDGQVNPFGRGGVYLPAIVRLRWTQARRAGPRPQRTDRSANPCIGIAQFREKCLKLRYRKEFNPI